MRALALYTSARDKLEQLKSEMFYHGTDVEVNSPAYRGRGIAVTDNTGWPDHVKVLLPNGNTWRYKMECVKPRKDLKHD